MMLNIFIGAELTAAVLLLVRFLFFMPMRVKGSSMEPTLHNGQWLLVRRTRRLQRGDVIICHYPGRYCKKCKFLREYFVKRLIGVPGDTIVTFGTDVVVNGMLLTESYIRPPRYGNRHLRREWKLGPGQYFVMGDNRGASNDSRRVGPLDTGMLVGHVLLPHVDFEALLSPWVEPTEPDVPSVSPQVSLSAAPNILGVPEAAAAAGQKLSKALDNPADSML